MTAWRMMLCSVVLACGVAQAQAPAASRGDLLLVVGAAGTEEYGTQFAEWTKLWTAAAERGHVRVTGLGTAPDQPSSLEKMKESLTKLAAEKNAPLWVVLVGHGTFDGRVAKFNLPGPDISAQELASLLRPLERPVAVVNCTSASSHFLLEISAPGRVVMTATSSGNEISFARFGKFLAEAVGSLEADLDKDQQVSLLEAFLRASQQTAEFYKGEGRLATEHAVMDDNGDSRMVELDGFDGIRPINRNDKATLLPDGVLAHQWHLIPSESDSLLSPEAIARRNELERRIAQLRLRKKEMSADEYYAFLEPLCVELAKIMTTK